MRFFPVKHCSCLNLHISSTAVWMIKYFFYFFKSKNAQNYYCMIRMYIGAKIALKAFQFFVEQKIQIQFLFRLRLYYQSYRMDNRVEFSAPKIQIYLIFRKIFSLSIQSSSKTLQRNGKHCKFKSTREQWKVYVLRVRIFQICILASWNVC